MNHDSEMKEMEQKSVEQQEEIDSVNSEIEKLESTVKDKSQENSDLEKKLERAEKKAEDLKKKKTNLKEKKNILEDKVDNLEEEVSELHSSNSETKEKNEGKEASFASASTDTKINNNAGESSNEGVTLNMEATAYTAFCNTGCIGVTATGVDVKNTSFHKGKRIIAVDPNVIPLGATVRVDTGSSSFKATAQDTGGDIQGSRIDVLMSNKSKARSFGRQDVTVTILN